MRPAGIGGDAAELARLQARHPDSGDRDPRAARDVCLDHLGRVHPVDVVRTEDRDVVRSLVEDQVLTLEERVRAAGVPAAAEPLLGRHGRDVLPEHAGQAPGLGDVAVQRVRLVLGEHTDAVQPAVHHVRQYEVDQAVVAAERHRRLGTVRRQRPQSLSLATGQDDAQHIGGLSSGHEADPNGHKRLQSPGSARSHHMSIRTTTGPRQEATDRSSVLVVQRLSGGRDRGSPVAWRSSAGPRSRPPSVSRKRP